MSLKDICYSPIHIRSVKRHTIKPSGFASHSSPPSVQTVGATIYKRYKYEKESIMTEKSREMKVMSDEFKKEMTRVKENVSLSKLELSRFHDKVEKMQAQQESLGRYEIQLLFFCFAYKNSFNSSLLKSTFAIFSLFCFHGFKNKS